MRYEDLINNPLRILADMYRALDLGDFEPARKHVEAYLAGQSGYATNQYDLSPEDEAAVTRQWGHIFRRYGYAVR